MKFIQTIAYTTSKADQIAALADQQDNASSPGLIGIKVVKDRDRDNAYLVIAEFESYELAMENSARPRPTPSPSSSRRSWTAPRRSPTTTW